MFKRGGISTRYRELIPIVLSYKNTVGWHVIRHTNRHHQTFDVSLCGSTYP